MLSKSSHMPCRAAHAPGLAQAQGEVGRAQYSRASSTRTWSMLSCLAVLAQEEGQPFIPALPLRDQPLQAQRNQPRTVAGDAYVSPRM
jgi:hypothetical protein